MCSKPGEEPGWGRNGKGTKALSTSTNQANASPSWKQEVNQRVAAHKDRKASSIAEPEAISETHSSASRRAVAAAARVAARFRDEFCATAQVEPQTFALQTMADEYTVRIDVSQLHQILWNLCENALRHGAPADHAAIDGSARAHVELRLTRIARHARVCLEVADRGPGVDTAHVERIFEPFFTRGVQGTGLGLFLARDLAEINDVTLLYEPRKGGGSIFRLVFADASRWAETRLSPSPVS